MRKAVRLAKGMPTEPGAALLWIAQVVGGLQDNREARFARVRQRLVVFTDKKVAKGHERVLAGEGAGGQGGVTLGQVPGGAAEGRQSRLVRR